MKAIFRTYRLAFTTAKARINFGFVFLLLSIALLLSGLVYRGESILQIASALLLGCWFVFVPGYLLFRLFFPEMVNVPERILGGMLLGFTILPIIYHITTFLSLWNQYWIVQSSLNIVLLITNKLKRGTNIPLVIVRNELMSRISGYSVVLLIISVVLIARYFTQLVPEQFALSTVQEVDAGYSMGIVCSLRDFGACLDLSQNANPIGYHYYAYLLPAILSKYSGCTVLTTFQVLLPLIIVNALSLALYVYTRRLTNRRILAILVASGIWFIGNFRILSKLYTLIFPQFADPFYHVGALDQLYDNQSLILASALLIGILFFIVRDSKRFSYVQLIVIGIAIGVTAGYKAQIWVTLIIAMFFLLLIRREARRAYAFPLLIGSMVGVVVLNLTSVDTVQRTTKAFAFAMPLMENNLVQDILHTLGINGKRIFYDNMSWEIIVLVGITIPYWILLQSGVLSLWFMGMVRICNRIRSWSNAEIIGFTIFISAIVINIFLPLALFSYPSLYFYTVAVILLIPAIGHTLLQRRFRMSIPWKAIGILMLSVQLASGIVMVFRSCFNESAIGTLGGKWYMGMQYLRDSTETDAKLISNRYNCSERNPNYNERFYFLSSISERISIVSAKNYSINFGSIDEKGYNRLRKMADTILKTDNVRKARMYSEKLGVDLIVIDKWQGERLKCQDSSFVTLAFSNEAVDIFRVKKLDTHQASKGS